MSPGTLPTVQYAIEKRGKPNVQHCSLHANADNFNMQDVKDRFEQNPSYVALPREYQVHMHLLLRLGQQAKSLEDAKGVLAKAVELAEWALPVGVPQAMTEIMHKGVKVLVPKRDGTGSRE
jgi:hypothetical protein